MHRYLLLLVLLAAPAALAQGPPGTVHLHQKISDTEGGFTGTLDNSDLFGWSVASLGDLDGDGVTDLAVGAPFDDDGGFTRGAVWVLLMNANGTVRAHQKISDTEGGFTGTLDNDDRFGTSVTALGDLDGDGVPDLAVGAPWDDDGGALRGAVWVLFLNANGTVRAHQKISDTEGGFTGALDNDDRFGWSVASLGDLDGDGVTDLAAGAYNDDDGGTDRGAVWVLFLNANGTVRAHQKISDTEGGFTGALDNSDRFGWSVASLGDLDGDGAPDLAVGAYNDDDGGTDRGAVWVLFLNANGTVRIHQKISDLAGGFTGALDDGDNFGIALAALGDLDGDGVTDLAVGATGDDDGGTDRGAVWVLFLDRLGRAPAHQKISDTEGGFTGALDNNDFFGFSVAALGDLDGDGVTDLAVGARGDDDGGFDRGAVWVLFLNGRAPALTVSTEVASGAPVPPEGGPVRITVTVTNRTDGFVVYDLWMEADNAAASFSRQFRLTDDRVLNPYQSRTFVRTQRVPASAPAGTYTITVYAGDYPAGIVAADAFTVEKLASPAPRAWPSAADEDWSGTWEEVPDEAEAAVALTDGALAAAPNPARGATTLSFALAEAAPVRLAIYDALGREVAVLVDGPREAGTHAVSWDAVGLAAGVYVVRLDAGGGVQTRRVTVAR